MKRKNEKPEIEYEVIWLINGSVSFSQRYEGYEPAWREFSRLSRATGAERVLKETVFRVRDRGGEWKEAARCLVGPHPDEPPMPRIAVASEWGGAAPPRTPPTSTKCGSRARCSTRWSTGTRPSRKAA